MREKKPKRRRVEPRELLRRRGVITESEVLEWLREGRLYVYRDGRGEPRAFYLDEELLREPPWWARAAGNPQGAPRAGQEPGRQSQAAGLTGHPAETTR